MEHIQIASGPALVLPEFTVRSRREQPVRDIYNARQYEYWNTDAIIPAQTTTDKRNQQHQDMNPINTRTVTRDYRQAQPFVADGPSLGKNPYFQKFDVATDPRNVARELKSAVYEYNSPRNQETSQRLLSRNFDSRYVPEPEIKSTYEKAVDIYSGMRPKLNDMKSVFR